ncbi:predicted protein [Naegleria gruberi]|uniref:Predicted protein n=1 Tax=Naegleria gruberi TaxID=5762 RepID=D2UZ50_NAEGR|nr:uncharacterized protein NAEGRDRAFT_61813 [Naegleria gruberi]EFC49882.1 predicted protein [Naegleria gruberi]|eukprot:XP_002682626.1 predicted protein [Naegleria gruberi strain NEG-M]
MKKTANTNYHENMNTQKLFIFLLVFLSVVTLQEVTASFINSKNIYTFGYIYYSGFSPLAITPDTSTPIENDLLPKYLFNGTESWKLITGNETTTTTMNTSVKLQQIVTGMSVMFYVLEYFNSDTNSSLGQRILVSGSNMNGQGAVIKPPYIMSTPELIYIYSKDGQAFNPFSNSNRIIHMACLYSCLIVSSDGHVRYHYGLLEVGTGIWNVRFSAVSYNDPDNGQLLTGVKYVHATIGGYYGCETMFAVTNYGHVFSSGCHNSGLRGTSSSYSDTSVNLIPSLRNITTVSVGFLDGNGETGKTAAGAIDVNGVLWTWGSNFNGMLGWNSTLNVSETAQPVTLIQNPVTQVSFGFSHAIVMTNNGDVLCFGGNLYQQCDFNLLIHQSWSLKKLTMLQIHFTALPRNTFQFAL